LIRTCPQCGALNEQQASACCFCDFGLNPAAARSVSTTAPAPPSHRRAVEVAPTAGNLAVQADWHQEVHSRLAAYRARRRTLRQPEGQTALPFASAASVTEAGRDPAEFVIPPVDWLPPSPAVQSPDARARAERHASQARVPIAIEQPSLDWSGAAHAPSAQLLRPAASLSERRLAGLIDAAFLLFTFGGILALFCALGGRFTLTRLDAAITVATLGLFYAQYFTLFTVFGGSTPGMMLRGLRVVSFEGDTPSPRQMLWRSFGYLISAGAFMLGYLWALWDEDHLCLQDRISQTYLTPLAPGESAVATPASSRPGETSPALR
jgi:uncharacterized RDD family membrane protein YckC